MSFLLIAIPMMVLAALAGGSFPGSHLLNKRRAVGDDGEDLGGVMPINLTWVPEALMTLPFGLVHFDFTWFGILKGTFWWAVAYAGLQTSTGPALQWGENPADGMARPRRISPLVNWISDRLGFRRGDVNYCRAWMAVKGFLIGLPAGGVVLAVLWPLAYEAGHRLKSHLLTELLSGLAAAVALTVWAALFH